MPPKTTNRKRSFNFYKRTARTNGLVKRAKGNLFASKKQNDICDFTITFNHTFPVTSYTNPTTGAVASGYAMNIWDLLSKAPNFKAFQGMYDQVRINGVQVKLQTANSTLDTANNNQIYNVYTAWDIDGMDKSLVQPVTSVNQDDTHNIVGFISSLGNAIATYGSASKMQLNPYQRWSQNRSIYPSTMQEKTQFVSTDSIVDYHENYNINTHRFDFKGTYATAGLNVQANQVQPVFEEMMNQDNPALLTTNQKYPFKPTLYVDAFSSNTNASTNLIDPYIPVASDNKIVFSAEIKVACTFRGLKGTANVHDVQAQKHVTITENNQYLILPDEPYDVMRSVDLTVDVPQQEVPVIEEDKYQYIDSNGPLTISPTNGYDVMEKVSAVINVPVPTIESSKSYTIIPPMFVETYPLSFTNTVSPSTGYDAMVSSVVTVNLVDSSTNAYLLSNLDYVSEDGATRTVYYKAPTLSDDQTSSLMTIMSSEIKQNAQYSGLRRMNFKAKVQNKTITQNGVYYANDNETILNKITVNVQPKITIDRVRYEGTSFLFSNFTVATSYRAVTLQPKYCFIGLVFYTSTVRVKVFYNGTTSNINAYTDVYNNLGYYIIVNPNTSSNETDIYLRDPNENNVFTFPDNISNDGTASIASFYKSFFDFVI